MFSGLYILTKRTSLSLFHFIHHFTNVFWSRPISEISFLYAFEGWRRKHFSRNQCVFLFCFSGCTGIRFLWWKSLGPFKPHMPDFPMWNETHENTLFYCALHDCSGVRGRSRVSAAHPDSGKQSPSELTSVHIHAKWPRLSDLIAYYHPKYVNR